MNQIVSTTIMEPHTDKRENQKFLILNLSDVLAIIYTSGYTNQEFNVQNAFVSTNINECL